MDNEKKPRKPRVRRPLQLLLQCFDASGNPVTNVASVRVIDQSRDGRFSLHSAVGLVAVQLGDRSDDSATG